MTELLKYEHGNQLYQLRKIILDGISYFIVWQELNIEYQKGLKNLGQHKGFCWQYRGFFAPSRKALLNSALLELSKIYDEDNRTVNIRKLLKNVLNNKSDLAPYAKSDISKTILLTIDNVSELLERLRNYLINAWCITMLV